MKKFLLILIIFLAAFGCNRDQKSVEEKKPEEVKQGQGVTTKPLYISYFINNSEGSLISLQTNISRLDLVIGDFLRLSDNKGNLKNNDSNKASLIALSQVQQKKIVAMVSNYNGGWKGEWVEEIIGNEENADRLVKGLVKYALDNEFEGISLDFEGLRNESLPNFEKFVEKLNSALEAEGLALFIHTPPNDPYWNYKKLSENSTALILMAYDQHNSITSAGPIAGAEWFQSILDARKNDLSKEKTIVGLGNYAYDWKEGDSKGLSLGVLAAKNLAIQNKTQSVFDEKEKNSTYTYIDGSGKKHVVWILDGLSVDYQLRLLEEYNPAGVALFRLGSEDPTVWKYFNTRK